jgi:prepilin-type N-terminal cleavage/methylation domain-containing protein
MHRSQIKSHLPHNDITKQTGKLLRFFMHLQYPSQCKTSMNTGFTLIELLVFISIISLLIGILLPALASARKAARGVQCATQLRQVGYAEFTYAEDFKWFTTPRLTGSMYPNNSGDWWMTLRSYLAYDNVIPTDWKPCPRATDSSQCIAQSLCQCLSPR